jgi:hypothetical protein
VARPGHSQGKDFMRGAGAGTIKGGGGVQTSAPHARAAS